MANKKIRNKQVKVATAKALKTKGYGPTEIAELMGYSRSTIWKWLKEESEELNDIQTQVKKMIELKEDETIAKALGLIFERMDDAEYREIVGAYKVIKEGQKQENLIGQADKVLVMPSGIMEKYGAARNTTSSNKG